MLNFQSDTSAKRKILSIVLTFALAISMIPTLILTEVSNADENESEQATSLKDFERGVVYQGRQRTQEEIEKLQSQGCIVDEFDASDINYKESVNKTSSANLASESKTLPEKVDLRSTGKVTSVKSQGSTTTCWAWATAAAAETSIANSAGVAAKDYSPFQLAYFGITPLSSNAADLKGTEKTQAGEGMEMIDTYSQYKLSIFGSVSQAASMLMQGTGVALNTSIPFPEQSLQQGLFNDDDSLTPAQRRERVARLSKWNHLGSPITTRTESGQTTYVETDESVLAKMKAALANGNAVEIYYYGDSNIDPATDVYFNHATNAQYTYEYKQFNHGVCVVGYDDNYSKENFIEGHQPEKDGAFIVKNSWGTGWGDAGYFYLSYYDQSLGSASTFEFDTTNYDGAQIDDEEIVDQYDYIQAMSIECKDYDLSSTPSNKAWYSNIYTASQKQSVHSIATFVYRGMKTLGYKVYKLKSDATTPSDIEGSLDSPAAEGVVDIEDEGYLSVDLKSPLNLQQGEKYAVWFYQTDGNNLYYIVQTRALKNGGAYTSKAVVNKNESFNSYDPTAGWDEIDNSGYDERYVLDNYCVKAYATSCANSSFVKFNSNGGTSVPEQVVPNGGKVTEPAAPTKAGSTFLGWYKDEALSQKFDFDNDTVSADITLFAKWSTVDKTTTADETDEVVTKPATTNTPETPATTSSNEAEQASLTQTGDDLLAIVAAAIAVATVAFIYARRASKRRFHPKHARR